MCIKTSQKWYERSLVGTSVPVLVSMWEIRPVKIGVRVTASGGNWRPVSASGKNGVRVTKQYSSVKFWPGIKQKEKYGVKTWRHSNATLCRNFSWNRQFRFQEIKRTTSAFYCYCDEGFSAQFRLAKVVKMTQVRFKHSYQSLNVNERLLPWKKFNFKGKISVEIDAIQIAKFYKEYAKLFFSLLRVPRSKKGCEARLWKLGQ